MNDGPSGPRISPLPAEGDTPPLNIFRTLAYNEPLSKAFLQLGGHLLAGGVLPARVREIVILRVAWRAGSEYEFGQHTALGKAAGLTEEEIARLADSGAGEWATADRALVSLADELCDSDQVTDHTWQALSQRWNDAEMLELLVLAGFYRLVAGLLNSVGVALEATTSGWPAAALPRRRAPRDGAPLKPRA